MQRLFNRYRDNHAVRFALKCGNRVVSDAILGGDAYAEGFDAARLPVGKESSGVGYLYGAADHTPAVRTYLADAEDTEKIVAAARVLRERAGTLDRVRRRAGHRPPAAGTCSPTCCAVFGADPALHWPVLADRLAAQFPDRWADATADAVSAQCRDLGVASVVVKSAGQSLRGCRRADVQRAAAGQS